ncbi:MAG: GNAT family N-acetyltransferase [Flavobacterium sp.]|nr:MAG: GNAT family N-acetyltransferase [Flavobacterium sp.]
MGIEITIRPALPADLPEIKQLFVETIMNVCSNDYTNEQQRIWAATAENEERWTNALNDQYFVVAERESKIAGFASLANNNYFDFLYVHKDFQRQGIADGLYEYLERKALDSGTRILTSDVSKTARPFFERKGFKVVSEQTNVRLGIEIVNYKMEKEL